MRTQFCVEHNPSNIALLYKLIFIYSNLLSTIITDINTLISMHDNIYNINISQWLYSHCSFSVVQGGRPWPNRHSSCTTIGYKLDVYAVAGSIRTYSSMRLRCQVPADNVLPSNKYGKSRYRLYWVESTITQQFNKQKTVHGSMGRLVLTPLPNY